MKPDHKQNQPYPQFPKESANYAGTVGSAAKALCIPIVTMTVANTILLTKEVFMDNCMASVWGSFKRV